MLEDVALLRLQQVEPRQQDALDRVGNRGIGQLRAVGELRRDTPARAAVVDDQATIHQHMDDLFDVEGVALDLLQNTLAQLLREAVAGQQRVDQAVRAGAREGFERE